jgi:SAM-dependent methyltransferase
VNFTLETLQQIAKQLPPSAERLRFLYAAGGSGETLAGLVGMRPDLEPTTIEVAGTNTYVLPFPENSFDAVFLDASPDAILVELLRVLRPGGRLILIQMDESSIEKAARQLEAAGYARILSEATEGGQGVLARGEKPYPEGTSTLERISSVSNDDLLLAPGRYIHLLIEQEPNKPVWRMEPSDVITWTAVGIMSAGLPTALGFTSLPKAVSFMQNGVLMGMVPRVTKIPKFRKEVAAEWEFPVLLNPALEDFVGQELGLFLSIDPDSAEAPDE